MQTEEMYDYVVVGGGSAGSVVAGRLAEAGAQVCVLEAGGSDRHLNIMVPAFVRGPFQKQNWQYLPEPDGSRDGWLEKWSAGKVLGGGGSINMTVFVRGNRGDFDAWAKLGCDGWEYDSVLPYFKRMETWIGGGNDFRGGGGPIHVKYHGMAHPLNDGFLAAAQSAGHPFTPDYNGERQEGVGVIQVNQKHGIRSQASREYLRGLAPKKYLTVRTKALVNRIVFEGNRAVGVEYQHNGEVRLAGARSEVILSSGALASPKVLKLSGVGPRDELERLGIPVVHDSPGVGENLQEQPVGTFGYRSKVPTLNKPRARDIAKGIVDFVRDGSGPLAVTVFHVQVMHRLRGESQSPDIQTAFCAFLPGKEVQPDGSLKIVNSRDWGCNLATTLTHPRARGRIRLRSASPSDPPIIEHELFSNGDDVSDLVAGMEEGRRIMAEPAMKDLAGEMVGSQRDCRSRADWERWLRRNATFGIHPVGSCMMGTDDFAVVDPDLRVIGVTGLRVIDASIMPTETTGNTNAASMMIGEKGADLVLDRR